MKSTTSKNREAAEDAPDFVPGFRSELGSRILTVVQLYKSKGEAAGIMGVGVEQLGHYTSGKSKPSFEVLIRLAEPHKISLDWLATGQEPMRKEPPPPVNRALLVDVIEQVEGFLKERRATLQPDSKARLIGTFYKAAHEAQGRLSRETLHELFGLVQPKD